jgi:hypothetical protein
MRSQTGRDQKQEDKERILPAVEWEGMVRVDRRIRDVQTEGLGTGRRLRGDVLGWKRR